MKTNHIKRCIATMTVLCLVAQPFLNAQNDAFFTYSDVDARTEVNWNVNNQGFGSGWNIGGQGFGGGWDIGGQGFGDGWNINAETFGETPLGDGLAILAVSAAGYAFIKRRKSSKHKTHSINFKH